MSSSEEAKLTREDIDEQDRDDFAKTLMKLFEPMVKQLDEQVAATKYVRCFLNLKLSVLLIPLQHHLSAGVSL
jgi:hypothetical protein